MLGQADRDLRIDYLVCPAEALPLAERGIRPANRLLCLALVRAKRLSGGSPPRAKAPRLARYLRQLLLSQPEGQSGLQSLVRVHLLPTLPCATSRQPPSRRSICQTSRLRIGQGREVLQRRLLQSTAADRLPADPNQRHRGHRSRRVDARTAPGPTSAPKSARSSRHPSNKPSTSAVRSPTCEEPTSRNRLPLARHHAPRYVLQRRPLPVHQQVGPEQPHRQP